MTDLDTILITAHRGNMRRYQRLLRTPLTDLERSFVLRGLDEEKSALADLLRNRAVAHAEPRTIVPQARGGPSPDPSSLIETRTPSQHGQA